MAPDLLTLFADPSVALLYYMSLIVFSFAALFMALGQRLRGPAEKMAGRYALASAGIALSWIALMAGAVAVIVSGQTRGAILPPLNRAASAMVILLAGWAFLGTEASSVDEDIDGPPRRSGQVLITLLALAVGAAILVGYGYTAVQWYTGHTPSAEFNLSSYGRIWTIATLVLAAVMLILMVIRFRITVDAPLKILFMAAVIAGYGYTFAVLQNGALRGDESGAIQLAFLVAMAILPVVVYRLVVDRLTVSAAQRATQATVSTLNTISTNLIDTTVERESVTLLKALGIITEKEQPDELPRQIVIAAATLVKADVTALLVLDDAEYADVIAAYDSVQQRPIAAMAFKLDEQPTLQDAILSRTQRALMADQHLNELVDVYTRLDIQKIGPVYFQPLIREGVVVGVLVVALPYTQRDLRENEKRLLESLSPVASRMVTIARAAQRNVLNARSRSVQAIADDAQTAPIVSAARAEMQASLELARSQINELSAKVRELQIELDFERSRLAELASDDPEGMSITQRMEKMSMERRQLEAERERLIQALNEAQTQLASATGSDDEVYEAAIHILQKERDELQAQKEQLEAQLTELRSHGEATAPAVLRELLTRLAEEKSRLAVERDHLKSNLDAVESQLAALGIEGGPASLVTTIVQLTEERSQYKTVAERATQDRDALLTEIRKFQDRIAREKERDAKIASLENEVRRLAQDREVLIRQRDTLSNAQGAQKGDREQWEVLRTRMLAEMSALRADLETAIFERNHAAAERNKLAQERATLLTERDRLLAGRTALQTERDQLLARVEGNREVLQQLGADGVGALKTMIDDLTEERSELEHQLLQAHTTLDRLRAQLDEARRKPAEGDKARAGAALDEDTAAVLLSVAQELRTPLTSVAAYVDLLLGESVGILGELQRQFLQRVKANSDRLATLVEDFVRVVAIDTGQLKLDIGGVDMGEVIDDAITATRTQFREKGITLKLDLPEQLPPVPGDRGALQQVVVELLSNAYRASPTDGQVAVRAETVRNFVLATGEGGAERTGDAVLISVQDWGGGVPPEEQARVFSRMYRADRPLIQGVGDTTVGLSIARALTEMHGGRIWLDSEPGQSSTFTLALPLVAAQAGAQQAEAELRANHVTS